MQYNCARFHLYHQIQIEQEISLLSICSTSNTIWSCLKEIVLKALLHFLRLNLVCLLNTSQGFLPERSCVLRLACFYCFLQFIHLLLFLYWLNARAFILYNTNITYGHINIHALLHAYTHDGLGAGGGGCFERLISWILDKPHNY